jgi:MoxR-like ATPase
VLADEINRTTPKTQSALLEAMSERQVTMDQRTHRLPRPFIVLATQNPIEHHGTYPLPESQLDRFLMRIRIGYPDEKHEKDMLRAQQLSHPIDALRPVLDCQQVSSLQEEVRRVTVDGSLVDYLARFAATTRQSAELALGVSPRGTLSLQRAAQARALVLGRRFILPDDVKALAVPVLAHRVVPQARVAGERTRIRAAEEILTELLDGVPVPL